MEIVSFAGFRASFSRFSNRVSYAVLNLCSYRFDFDSRILLYATSVVVAVRGMADDQWQQQCPCTDPPLACLVLSPLSIDSRLEIMLLLPRLSAVLPSVRLHNVVVMPAKAELFIYFSSS